MEAIESVGKNRSVEELLKVRICEEHNCLKCCFLYLSSTFFILMFGHQVTGSIKTFNLIVKGFKIVSTCNIIV